jgi:cytochrome c oxidase assembly protein subunit 15
MITPANSKSVRRVRGLGILLIHLVAINIFSGATMAGIDAGKVFNTWPTINGQLIPDGMYKLEPFYKNFFENVAWYQK